MFIPILVRYIHNLISFPLFLDNKKLDTYNKSTEILIKNTSSIDNYAFAGLPNLEMIEIADGVEEIGTGAFAACPNLKTIILPESLKTIGPQAFACCENFDYELINHLIILSYR